jgi:hypothetical protein
MSDEAEKTFTMPLAGREIEFRHPLLGQVLILDRFARKAVKAASESEGEESGRTMMSAIARTLDFIQTLVVSEDDKQFLEDQMLAGTIDWPDVMAALSGGTRKETVADDQAPPARKRAPKKSPKAAPAAKTVASRGRTQR